MSLSVKTTVCGSLTSTEAICSIQRTGALRAGIRVHVGVVGELDVIRGEGLAVMPLHALLEGEGVRLAVRRDVPFRREVRHGLQCVRIDIDEAVEEQTVNQTGRRIARRARD